MNSEPSATAPNAWAVPAGVGLLLVAPILLLVILAVAKADLSSGIRATLAAILVVLAAWATYIGWKLIVPNLHGKDIP